MRSQFLIALFLTFVGASSYWYQVTAAVCPAPLSYRLGELDSSFGISSAEAIQSITDATAVWEKAAQRDLFTYDENADFTVDFVYDERQKTADYELTERELLDAKRAKSDQLKAAVESLQAEYQKLSDTYENRVTKYESRLEAHNIKVNQYNDRGGAPADVFAELEKERTTLNTEAEALTSTAAELKNLAAKINQAGDEGNSLVESYNREVVTYNSNFGFTNEFTQGDYQGKHIHVYKFSSPAELQTVLVHEFGHSLGLDHVEGSSSVMYYLLDEKNQINKLSGEDMSAYYAKCGTAETFEQKIRRLIRSVLL
ncbi:MAG: hypothetical protein RLZZ230_131 [Candidatus Parcubacteria bacterium]|jgi:predicted  nucleic acid-binding Zn-ribbon protein